MRMVSMNLQALCHQAAQYHQTGQFKEAERLYIQILKLDSRNFFACHMLGILRSQQGRHTEAFELIKAALKINPNSAEAQSNCGNILAILGRDRQALEAFDKALMIGPQYAETLTNRSNILLKLKRPQDAFAGYQAALGIKPDLLEALVGGSNALRQLKRFQEALEYSERSILIKPDSVEALNNRGAVLSELRRFEEALVCFDKALAISPNSTSVLINRGCTLQALHRPEEALADLDTALKIKPDNPEALSNRGIALSHLGRFDEALASFARAIAIAPGLLEALSNRGHTFRRMHRPNEALASYEEVLAVDPNYCKGLAALSDAANMALSLCDWSKAEKFGHEIKLRLARDGLVVAPLVTLLYGWDPQFQADCAKNYVQGMVAVSEPIWNGPIRRHDKIRIAYMSSDFRRHPIASVVTELFERHDRSRFEVLGISLGEDDGSQIRTRITQSVDRFVDVCFLSDRRAAELLHQLEVDILIDLNGHTHGARPDILSHRAVPVQVNYMGYPGTMGAGFIDYIIADETVLPFDQQAFYREKIVHLPDTYWVCDTKRSIGKAPSRSEALLPAQGFVFCCFNNYRKITKDMFDIWMRLLVAVPDSVLWLKTSSDQAMANLQREAAARQVAASRLIFAEDVPADVHLARHTLADLFLDTLPYNAHATACDALWAGLPVMTCLGPSFAGRVAASQLRAVGLPELVTHSLEEYEALTLRLVRDPALLACYRDRLAQRRPTTALFNTDLFRANIEQAYMRMWEIARRGEPPHNFRVTGSSNTDTIAEDFKQ